MKLENLPINKTFTILNGNGKVYNKISSNDNLTYCWCKCMSALPVEIKIGLMLDSGNHDHRFNKNINIIPFKL